MMNNIRDCSSHGYYTGDECPKCGKKGREVVTGDKAVSISKLLTYILRHNPSDYNVSVDETGLASIKQITQRANNEDDRGLTEEQVEAVGMTNKRFEVVDGNIRALYSHSIEVSLPERTSDDIPRTLYHGTVRRNIDSIMEEGLKPMTRQKVLVTDNISEAERVGNRHKGDTVILEVNTTCLEKKDIEIIERTDGVYAVDYVHPSCLSEH